MITASADYIFKKCNPGVNSMQNFNDSDGKEEQGMQNWVPRPCICVQLIAEPSLQPELTCG